MSPRSHSTDRTGHPLEVVEHVALRNNWSFERSVEDEIVLIISGTRTNYQVSFTWLNEIEILHVACAFEMKVPKQRLSEVQQLVVGINEQLWIGHFDVWTQDGMVMFRHALLSGDNVSISGRQCEAALGSALDTCERYYPAFQFVVWADRSAREAMDAVMFENIRPGVAIARAPIQSLWLNPLHLRRQSPARTEKASPADRRHLSSWFLLRQPV